jgi:AcrR family transcriptional regulator
VALLGKSKKEVLLAFRTSEILAAARQVFARYGYNAARVDEIADAAGVAKGTIYLYFPSKREIFLATLRQGVEELHAEAQRVIDGCGTVTEKVRAFVGVRLDYCARNREFFRIYFEEFSSLPVRSSGERPEFQDLYDAQAHLLESILALGIERGEVRPCPVRTTARLIYDLTRSAIAQHVLDGERSDVTESTDLICDLIWRGIRC